MITLDELLKDAEKELKKPQHPEMLKTLTAHIERIKKAMIKVGKTRARLIKELEMKNEYYKRYEVYAPRETT